MNSFRATFATVLLSLLAPQTHAEQPKRPEPNYVGGGRYTCHDKTVGCALIKQNNRRLTQEKTERTDRKRYTPLSDRRKSSLKPAKGNESYYPRFSTNR